MPPDPPAVEGSACSHLLTSTARRAGRCYRNQARADAPGEDRPAQGQEGPGRRRDPGRVGSRAPGEDGGPDGEAHGSVIAWPQALPTRPTSGSQKVDALHSRIKILETENRDLRQKLQLVLEKTANDDKLVEAYKGQLENLRRQLRDNSKGHGELVSRRQERAGTRIRARWKPSMLPPYSPRPLQARRPAASSRRS